VFLLFLQHFLSSSNSTGQAKKILNELLKSADAGEKDKEATKGQSQSQEESASTETPLSPKRFAPFFSISLCNRISQGVLVEIAPDATERLKRTRTRS